MFRFDEDMHVHSTWSDGKHSLLTNVEVAESRGVRVLGCVDHVRRDTTWVGDFARAVHKVQSLTKVQLVSGLEAKILNVHGELDVPKDHREADMVLAADHQVPIGDGHENPKTVMAALEGGMTSSQRVVDSVVRATIACMERYSRVVVAHLFSVLPKCGLSEEHVSDAQIEAIVRTAHNTGAVIEFDERWRCPGPRLVRAALDAGVHVWMSTDAHRADRIGLYVHARQLSAEVFGESSPVEGRFAAKTPRRRGSLTTAIEPTGQPNAA